MTPDFYKQLITNAPCGYAHHEIILDNQGKPVDYRFIEVNRAFEQLTGLKKENLIGHTVREAIPGIENGKFDWISCYGEIALGGTEKNFEQYSQPLDKWYKVSAFSNEKMQFTTIFTDITDYRNTQQELNRFKSISDNAIFGKTISDLDGNLTYINKSFANIHGYTPKELKGKHLSIFHTPRQLRLVEQIISRFKQKGYLKPTEVWHVKRSGKEFPMLMSGIIIKDDDNSKEYIAITAMDLSKIKKMELDIAENKNLLTSVFQSIQEGICVLNNDLTIRMVNAHMEKMYSHHTPLVGKKCYHVYQNRHEPCELCPSIAAIKNKKVSSLKMKFLRDNIQTGWLEVFAYPLIDQKTESVTGVVEFVRDITDLVKIQEELVKARDMAEESNKLKTAFINNISHEIRTPLNGILGFGHLIMEEGVTPNEKKAYHKLLQVSSNRLQETITSIMDIAEITAGTLKPKIKEVPVKKIISTGIEIIEDACSEKSIIVTLDIADDQKPDVIKTDQELFGKIMTHLLSNAEKFTEKGQIRIGYRAKRKWIEFFVSDTGKGMSDTIKADIFKPFVQEDPSITRGHEGSGLGLPVARGLVKLLGGKIWVESTEGKGSTFFFTLPYDKQAEANPEPEKDLPKMAGKTGETLILIAEDDEANYLFLQTVVKNAGFSPLHAQNGLEAVELCRQNADIALVIMDIKMPVMNGLEATKQIKEFRPHLPVIAATAHAETGYKHKISEAGCDEYLVKPIKIKELTSMIKKMLAD